MVRATNAFGSNSQEATRFGDADHQASYDEATSSVSALAPQTDDPLRLQMNQICGA